MVSGSLVLSVSGSERTSKPDRRHKLGNNHHQNGDNDDEHDGEHDDDIVDDIDDYHDDDDEPSKGEEGYESRGGGDQQVAKQENLKLFQFRRSSSSEKLVGNQVPRFPTYQPEVQRETRFCQRLCRLRHPRCGSPWGRSRCCKIRR